MKTKVFNLLLEFHLGLIRAKPKQSNIDKARAKLTLGDDKLGCPRADRLEHALLARQEDLIAFYSGNWQKKVEVYNKNYTTNPNPAVFDALKFVLYNGESIGAATSSCGVNFQSVKVLKPRWEKYVDFGVRLNELLNTHK